MASIHLGRLVGPGGFSRLVAMKVLHPLYADEEHYTMLLDEARLSARVRHPNVVQTLDVVHDEGRVCIVMEYVHGVDLATAADLGRRETARMPHGVASSVLVGALQGLHAAHEARGEDGSSLCLVHRDVSPQNIVVGIDGAARVLDFGIAKALRKEHVTVDGRVKGKVAYMAPEQLVGAVVTRQADIYAAGVVLWEALTGQRLFEDVNEASLVARVLGAQVPPPSSVDPTIGSQLDGVVLRATAAERRDRFSTAQEMAAALAAAAPPATSEDVARWIERVAEEAIEARTCHVREAEAFVPEETPALGAGGEGPRDALPPELPRAVAAAYAADGSPSSKEPPEAVPSPSGRPRVLRAAAWIGAIAALTTVAAVLGGIYAHSERHGRDSQVTASVSETSAAIAPSASGAASVEISPTASPLVPALPVVPGRAPRGVSSGPSNKPTAGRSPGRHTPAHTAHHPDCDPPYTIDGEGLKHYKVSCLP